MITENALHEKLIYIIKKYCKTPLPQLGIEEISLTVDELVNALGGCYECFGKGYILDQEDLIKKPRYCVCKRAQELMKYFREAYN